MMMEVTIHTRRAVCPRARDAPRCSARRRVATQAPSSFSCAPTPSRTALLKAVVRLCTLRQWEGLLRTPSAQSC